jgi:radical SAM protein with 4Fe4S-binding SPASM domain
MSGLPDEYGALVRELHARATARRQPLNGTFELTARCNLACRMCYIARTVPGNDELTAGAWLALARAAMDEGMLFLLLTGGEVLTRPDFFDLYMPLTRSGLVLTLFTNGTLINDDVAARLAEAPPSRTEITLYGATATTYEAITGVPGSFARCCAGIDALVRRRVPLGLKTMITRQNVAEVEAMRQMAHGWGVPFSGGWLVSRRRDGAASAVEHCRLSAAACAALEATDPIARKAPDAARSAPATVDDRNFYCQAGRASFVINPHGEMGVCVDLPAPAARPLDIGFRAAWAATQRVVATAPPLCDTCRDCAARVYCPRCPAWSQLETNTLNEPVPYLCEVAWARKEQREHAT